MDVMISLVIGFITALATVAMAAFTFILYRATDRLFTATKESADAAKLSAEALIGAERAHLFVEITGENIREVVGRGGFFDKSETMWGNDVETLSVTYKLVNYGRTMAMLKEVSDQIIAGETFPQPADHVLREQMPFVIPADDESPELTCLMVDTFTVGDCVKWQRRNTSVWFFGYVKFQDTFGRDHQWDFRFQCSKGSGGFRLVYQREYPLK